MSDDDLHNNLLGQGKKGAQTYQKRIQEIQHQIHILRNKNNMLQKQSDNDIDDQDIKKEIYQQSQFVQAEINKIKKLLQKFAQDFKDPTAKNKLKEMWKNASKEIQRNKIITERIVNDAPRESFMNKDERLRSSLMGRKSKGYDARRSRESQEIVKEIKGKNTMATKQATQEAFDDSQFALQNQIAKQKNELLNHLEQKNQKINQVMNQIALMVDQQGQNVNLITENTGQANENLVSANEQLDGAIIQQKKAKRKYCCIAAFLVLVVVGVVGVVFIVQGN